MGRVHRLDSGVIDRIAAGEVVERPASVVKELVENAVDAGATRIVVELSGGGADRIRVTDDGCGMDRDDATLCIERHATSKIRSDADLLGVTTLGFRGEALPSIASVSRFQLTTRRAEDAVGTRVFSEGGAGWGSEDAGGPPGTTITVDDLFFNVPARRKFLRTTGTELAHCQDVVLRVALSRPEIDVRVSHEGREVLRAPKAATLAARVAQLLRERGAGLTPVSFTAEGVTVEGLVGGPGATSPDAGSAWMFVNDRFVRDAVVRRGLAEGFDGLLPRGRHPVAVLNLRVAPDALDVNVHPAKIEVRFRDPGAVTRTLAAAIRSAFGGRTEIISRGGPLFVAEGRPPLPLRPAAVPVPPHPDDDPSFVERARTFPAFDAIEPITPAIRSETAVETPAIAASAETWRDLRPLGQHDGWLVCAGRDAFWFVDAPGAALRMARLSLPEVLTHRRLDAVVVCAVPGGRGEAVAALGTQAGVGLVLDALDSGRVVVSAVPAMITETSLNAFAEAAVAELCAVHDLEVARDSLRDLIAGFIPWTSDTEVGWRSLLATLEERGVTLGPPLATAFGVDEVARRAR